MTAAPRPSDFDCRSHGNHGADGMQKSLAKVFDPRSFRAVFAARWAGFLRANYRNPEEVAVHFGVRYQTALNWWDGLNRPSGDVVAMAFLRHGADMTRHLEG